MILIRYGELGLKGKLRRKFENTLISNIRRVACKEGIKGCVKREWGRLYFTVSAGSGDFADFERLVAKRLSCIFGVVSTSPAVVCSSDLDEIAETAEVFVDDVKRSGSFAVRARRSGSHEYTSMDVARIVGERIKRKSNSRVDLKNPDFEVFIEVRNDRAYVFSEVFRGYGGLPVGTQGRVLAMDELSAWFALRRGCDVDLTVDGGAVENSFSPEQSSPEEILKAWACYRNVGKVKLGFEEALKSDYPAVFCSCGVKELIEKAELLKERKTVVLTPFASEKVYSREQVKKILKSISGLVECVRARCRYLERER